MTASLWRLLIGLGVLLTIGGCKGKQRTELVVEVGSNLAVPVELDKIDLAITSNGTTQHTPYSLVRDFKLPVLVGIVETGNGAGTIEIVATGYLNGSPIVNETAVLGFFEEKSMLLKLFLAAECRGDPCTDPTTTCTKGGICRGKVRAPSDLTPYVPGNSPSLADSAAPTSTGGTAGFPDSGLDQAVLAGSGGSGGSATGFDGNGETGAAGVPDSRPDVLLGGMADGSDDSPGTGGRGSGGNTSAGGTLAVDALAMGGAGGTGGTLGADALATGGAGGTGGTVGPDALGTGGAGGSGGTLRPDALATGGAGGSGGTLGVDARDALGTDGAGGDARDALGTDGARGDARDVLGTGGAGGGADTGGTDGSSTGPAIVVKLGLAKPFAIAATAGVTNTITSPITHTNGNIVLTPNATCNAVTVDNAGGFGLCGGMPPTINGSVITSEYPDTTTATAIKADLNAAFLSITPLAGPPAVGSLGGGTPMAAPTTLGNVAGSPLVLGDNWFTPGVYTSITQILITGDITLDGQGDPNAVFVFQSASSLTTADGGPSPSAHTRILLTNGTKASNVWWQVASSATMGFYCEFQGNILAAFDITMKTGSTTCGRAMAGAWVGGAGAFIFDSNVVSVPGNGCPL